MPRLSAPVQAGIIGYGPAFNMGLNHSTAINSIEGLQVTAVCDLDSERLEAAREELGDIKTYSKVADVAADPDIQLVIVILPHNLHCEVAVACLGAGKHVVVEKPMAISIDECTQMIEAAKKRSLMLSVFHNRRWDGDFNAIKDIIEQGYIGEVFHLEAHSGGYRPPGTSWRSEKAVCGGAFYDWGAHFVDWVLHLIPSPITTVSGQFQKRVWGHVTNEDHVEAYIKFASSAVAHVELSSIAAAGKPRWYILGTKGAIVDSPATAGTFTVSTAIDPRHVATFDVPYYQVPFPDGAKAFYQGIGDHLLRDEPLHVTPESARRVIAVMDLAERSSKSGSEQEMPYEDEAFQNNTSHEG